MILYDLATTREKIRKVKWVRPDISESTYIETIGLMAKNEGKLFSNLNAWKLTLKKLLKEAQNYYEGFCNETIQRSNNWGGFLV